MTEHKHAWFLRALADGEPLGNFESCYRVGQGFDRIFAANIGSILLHPHNWQIRRKPRMVKIGDVEVQAGITEVPERGTWIWVADPAASGFAFTCHWEGDLSGMQRFQRGLIHLTQENAVAMGKALAALTEVK